MCVSKIMSIDLNIARNMTTYKDCLYTLYIIKSCIHNVMYDTKNNLAAKKVNPVKIIHLLINNRALVDKKRLNGNGQIFLHRYSWRTKI